MGAVVPLAVLAALGGRLAPVSDEVGLCGLNGSFVKVVQQGEHVGIVCAYSVR